MKKTHFLVLAMLCTLSLFGCQKKEEETIGLPDYDKEGNCTETTQEISGSCKIRWKNKSFATNERRYIEFGANLHGTGSRITLVLNATNEALSDGVHITFSRDNQSTLGNLRLDNTQFNMDLSRTTFWVPTGLRLTFDFHPQGTNPPRIYIWRHSNGPQTATTADVSTEALPPHFVPTPTGSSGTGDFGGIILYEATLFNEQYKQNTETKVP